MGTNRLRSVGAALVLALAPTLAHAQDSEEATLQAAHEQFVQAINGMDYERLASMFAENAVYQPATGDMLQGREEIREWYEKANFSSVQIDSTHTEPLTEDLYLDLGSYSATVSRGAVEHRITGEYVTVAEIEGDTMLIRSLSAFPERNMQLPN